MTKETHELVYETSLKNMNDDKFVAINNILLRRDMNLAWLVSEIIVCTPLTYLFSIWSWFISLAVIAFAAILPCATLLIRPTLKSLGFTKSEYREFIKSGGRKHIKQLLREYIKTKKAILSGKFEESDAEKSLIKLNILENEFQSDKQETLNEIQENYNYYLTLEEEMNDIDANLKIIQTQKENLIKQLSARKAAEKAKQVDVKQVEKHNTEKMVDKKEEIIKEENTKLN